MQKLFSDDYFFFHGWIHSHQCECFKHHCQVMKCIMDMLVVLEMFTQNNEF